MPGRSFPAGTTCVMPASHPLAAKDAIDVNELARNDLILLGRQRINRNELEHELRRMVPSYRCSLEVHSVETACACAAQGLGIAIVPTLIAEFFRGDAIAMRPFLPDKVSDYGIITLPPRRPHGPPKPSSTSSRAPAPILKHVAFNWAHIRQP